VVLSRDPHDDVAVLDAELAADKDVGDGAPTLAAGVLAVPELPQMQCVALAETAVVPACFERFGAVQYRLEDSNAARLNFPRLGSALRRWRRYLLSRLRLRTDWKRGSHSSAFGVSVPGGSPSIASR
jgi:hypothetical protein